MMPDNETLDDFQKEFENYRSQKSRKVGGVERRVLQNLAMYVGEQWVWYESGTLRNRNPKQDENGRITEVNLILDLIGPAFEDIYGRLTASSPEFRAFPDSQDADKIAKAEVVTMAIQAANERLDEDFLRHERWFWMMFGGVAIEHTPWRRNLEVSPIEKNNLIEISGEEVSVPIWTHIPTGEEIPEPEYQHRLEMKQALPEHFKRAMELKLIGDFTADVRGPLNVFCPNSIKTFEDLQPGQSVMFGDIRLLSWAKKTWPEADFTDFKGQEDFKILTTRISERVSFVNTSLHDLIPVIQGATDDEDPEMIFILERYEPVSDEFPPGWSREPDASTGQGFIPAPSEDFANGGRYSVFSPDIGVLRDGEIPYQDGIPATDIHWTTSATNFWSLDWCTRCTGPQKSVNTLASQMRMMSNARIFDPVLITDDLKVPETDSPRNWVGAMSSEGVPLAGRLNADHIPAGYQKQLDKLVEMFDRISGITDLFQQPKFPGQIRGTGAVQMLQDLMDSKWGPKLRHYYKQVGKIYHRRINRMKQFYDPVRTMRMTDSTGKVEVFRFHTDEVLRADVDYFINVEPSTIQPETRRQRFSRMSEMLGGPLAGLYIDQNTQQYDWDAIAAELEFGDFKGREASVVQDMKFAKYVIASIKEGRPVPPIIGVENHRVFLKELRLEMTDNDFWEVLSPETREQIFRRWQEHGQKMAEAQQQQQQSVVNEQTMQMMNQAIQQSFAKMQSEITEGLLSQVRNLAQTDPEGLRALLFQGQDEQSGGVV